MKLLLAFLICWRDVRRGIRNGLADAAVRRGDFKRAVGYVLAAWERTEGAYVFELGTAVSWHPTFATNYASSGSRARVRFTSIRRSA